MAPMHGANSSDLRRARVITDFMDPCELSIPPEVATELTLCATRTGVIDVGYLMAIYRCGRAHGAAAKDDAVPADGPSEDEVNRLEKAAWDAGVDRALVWYRDQIQHLRDRLREADQAMKLDKARAIKCEAAQGTLFRTLSNALTGGNAGTWDEVIYAAEHRPSLAGADGLVEVIERAAKVQCGCLASGGTQTCRQQYGQGSWCSECMLQACAEALR